MQSLTPELARQIAADYPSLQSLNLSHNALRDVRHLQLLPRSLSQLDLGVNRLHALPLELGQWLPQLRLLRVRGNALESLRPLAGCSHLETLDVGDNRVALVSELRFLQPLAQLRHLSMDGNPVAQTATYRREALAMLPQLQSLDGQDVTAGEKLYAKLQLKTHVNGGAGGFTPPNDPSPVPSPTRLLTPDSLRTQRGQEQVHRMPLTSLRVEVNGGAEEEEQEARRMNDRDFRTDVDRVDEQPTPSVTSAFSAFERATMVLSARRPSGRNESVVEKQSDYYSKRDFQDTHHQAISSSRDDKTTSALETKEALLKSRVEALEGILAVQDRTMRHTLARFGGQVADSRLNIASKNDSGVVPTVEAAAAVYTRLMAAWREKCVALLVQTRSSELAHETRIQEFRQQEAQICDELARSEEKLEMWRQRAADFEAQRDLEVVTTHQAEERQAQANSKAVQAVRGLALEREKLQHLAESVVRFTGGLVRDKVEQLTSGSARLEALERRLSLAKDRIELAATLVAHREARLRNSEAALESERRVWAHRLEQMRNLTSQKENECSSANVVIPPLGDEKILRPATETALRALFHRLDSYDTGLVRAQVLLQALRLGDSGVLSAVGGPKKLSKLVTHVETAIRKLSLAGGATATLTWGEFMLFFIPESSVSLSALLQDNDGDSTDRGDITLVKPSGVDLELSRERVSCILCTAVKSNGLPNWPFTFSEEPTKKSEGEILINRRKERRILQTLSHAELVQQNTVLLADRQRLRRLLARDAHDLRDRVRGVRREWEAKTSELSNQKDILQRKLDEQDEELCRTQKQRETAEAARDEAFLEIQRLHEQLLAQRQEFEQHKTKLEVEGLERLQQEQEIWQTEIQDVRLAHSLLQADHSKQQVHIRQLERDLARQKEALLAHETERVASLEEKVRRRDTELTRLRRERNTILSSLREQERKLAEVAAPVEPTPTETVSTQTEEALPLKQRTVASQTTSAAGGANYEREEGHGGRMNINEISTPSSLDGDGDDDKSLDHRVVKTRPTNAAVKHLSPEDVNLRLQKLQSLTESLLAD